MKSVSSPPSPVAEDQLEAMYRHARAEYPRECCGYVLGVGPSATVVPCENLQDELHSADPIRFPRTAHSAYSIGGPALLRLARSFDSPRPATLIYHSHPDVGAYFSDEDMRAALAAGYPVDYLVIDVTRDRVRGAKLFRHRDGDFIEIAEFNGSHQGP